MLLEHLQRLSSQHIVLASASPRRKAILQNIGLHVKVVPSTFEEDLDKSSFTSAADYAVETAVQKAREVAMRRPWDADQHPALIIGADTVVELQRDILEKPRDAADAEAMLSRLSGQTHNVHTGVALMLPPPPGADEAATLLGMHSFSCTTAVEFGALTPADIAAYIESGEPFGKAGAYGIQGPAAVFVRRVDGCYFNVVGFPVHAFSAALAGLMQSGQLRLQHREGAAFLADS